MSRAPKRLASRLGVLIALLAVALFFPPVLLHFILRGLSPFFWACTLLSAPAVGIGFFCGLPMLVFVAWRRRGFCHYFCPMGLIVETCAKARNRTKSSYTRVPRFGQWAALLSTGGAFVSVPLFLVLDPMAIFVGAVGAARTASLAVSGLAYAGLFAFIIVLSLLFPLLWCRRLCPLGATQDMLAAAGSACRRYSTAGPDECNGPDRTLARRAFLGTGGGLAVSVIAVQSAPCTAAGRLRPPGSVREIELSALCVRCGNCVRSCPTGIIRPDLSPRTVTALLVPALDFGKNHCLETCNLCGQNCPSGAIAPLPLTEKSEARIGLARIDTPGCLLGLEKECGACSLVCKRDAIVETFSRETYTVSAEVDNDRCTGCGACVAVCPPRVITVLPSPATD